MTTELNTLFQALEARCDRLQRENDELRCAVYALQLADQHKYRDRRWQQLPAHEKCWCYTYYAPNTGVKVQPI